jgi:hypothetical protein
MSKTFQSLIEEMVHEVLSEEVPAVMTPDDSSLIGTLTKSKQRLRQTLSPEVAANQEKQIDTLINKLLARRKGRATLNRTDIEKLDKWTRWLTFLPFGRAYRKGLAKYLRSKKEKRKDDPFRDFRRYSYQDTEPQFYESAEPMSEDQKPQEQEVPGETTVKYYHGSSQDFKPGALILPPSKTKKMSEKGRKKNLDVVFFTKDPKSALIYAGRAMHSLGGTPAVYEVDPQGPISVLNDAPGTTVFSAPYAKVLRKIKLK